MARQRNVLNRRLKQTARLALVAAGAAALAYWLRFSPLLVETDRARRGPIVAEVLGTGTLEPRVRATISSKISGVVQEITVDQGDSVSAGAMLVRLDDEGLRQRVAIAGAELEAARAKVDRLMAEKERASAVLNQAKGDFSRVRSLLSRKASSPEELEKATGALRAAQAGLSSAEAAIAEGRKELVAAEETLKLHRAELGDARLTAPFAGLVVQRRRNPGDIIVPGSPVLSLIDTRELWISAWVDETEMARLRPEQPARVVFRSEPGRSYPGRVARLGREADRETREFIVDVRVLEFPTNWAVGQRAEVYIETSRKSSACLVPTRFIVWRGKTSGAFVDEHGHAAWRPVEIGLRDGGAVEVVAGLEEGETVVAPLNDQVALRDGRRIRTP